MRLILDDREHRTPDAREYWVDDDWPSLKQMMNWINLGHYALLAAHWADKIDELLTMSSDRELRGLHTCQQTLIRWDCIRPHGARYLLTDRGRELMDEITNTRTGE